MLFFRQLQHLLPDATAWRVTTNKTLRRFLQGLAQAPSEARDFIDAIYQDLSPDTTRELATWERHFGLTAATSEVARRLQLAGAWSAQGGQSPRYLQDVVQAAGFNVWLHEWWQPGTTPRVARNPRDYTDDPRIGTVQCAPKAVAFNCTASDADLPDPMPVGVEVADLYPQCNRWLTNEVGYLVNLNLTRDAPPPVPDDSARWPYFLYWCGEVFGSKAEVPASRREEFERLLLKICPSQQWLVTCVDYVQSPPPSGWHTIYEIDFAAQPNQTLLSSAASPQEREANVTIGGQVFRVRTNSNWDFDYPNVAVGAQVVEGLGVVLKGYNTHWCGVGDLTGSALHLDYSTLPDWDPAKPTALMVYMIGDVGSEYQDGAGLSSLTWVNDNSVGRSASHLGAGLLHMSYDPGPVMTPYDANSNVAGDGTNTALSADEHTQPDGVFMLIRDDNSTARFSLAPWTGSMPEVETLPQVGAAMVVAKSAANGGTVFQSARYGYGTAATLTIKRLAVLQPI